MNMDPKIKFTSANKSNEQDNNSDMNGDLKINAPPLLLRNLIGLDKNSFILHQEHTEETNHAGSTVEE